MDTQFTIDDVKDLAHNPSDTTKIRIIDKLIASFDNAALSNEERLIAEDILRFLAADLSVSIRETISQKFAESGYLPKEVATKLAFDLEDVVALPVISKSNVLSEQDLIEIIEKSSKDRQKAVANRENLTANITAHIAHQTSAEVVETLVKNKKTHLPENVAEAILTNYSDNKSLLKSMIQFKRINLTQAHDMLLKVSEDLQNFIIVEYNIPSTTVNNLIHDSKEWVMLSMIKAHSDEAPNSPSIGQILTKLQNDGELTFSILIKGLSVGNLVFFEAALARIANVPFENIRKLLWEVGSDQGYNGIYSKCKFPESMQAALWELIKIVREERQSHNPESITQRIHHRLIKAAQAQQVKNLDYLVTIVAHNIRKLKK